jgi:hypothetical protein
LPNYFENIFKPAKTSALRILRIEGCGEDFDESFPGPARGPERFNQPPRDAVAELLIVARLAA